MGLCMFLMYFEDLPQAKIALFLFDTIECSKQFY